MRIFGNPLRAKQTSPALCKVILKPPLPHSTPAQAELDTKPRKTMSYTVPTLLLRNLHDVFGEIDPVRRRAAVDEIFHEDAYSTNPTALTAVAMRSPASRA